jgi:hypothetical protein
MAMESVIAAGKTHTNPERDAYLAFLLNNQPPGKTGGLAAL